jgi:DNA mismatch repair protein MutS2
MDSLKARAGRIVHTHTGEIGAVRAEARDALDAVVNRVREHVDGGPASSAAGMSSIHPPRDPEEGDRVAVGPLGLEGIVQSIHDGHAELDVRGKRMRARVEELRVLVPAGAGPAPRPQVRVNVELAPRGAATTEINVIGSHSEEAVSRVERFLDEAAVNDLKSLRIVHGYGTGALRRSIAEFLRAHPFVANFGPAPDNQGGGGVTVVELKE